MSYSIVLSKPWRYRHPRRGRCVMEPGRYRVPEEVSDDVAMRAVGEGMARREATFGAMFDRGAEAPVKRPAPRKKAGGRKKVAAVQPA